MTEINIFRLLSVNGHLLELSNLLLKTVNNGASIGFLPPITEKDCENYWNSVINPEVILLVAKLNSEIVGTVQLHLSTKKNGLHRAEIAKLMTHPNHQREGIGRKLMEKAEKIAREFGRNLLILDTREGDPSNKLYTSLGYIKAGEIPYFAKSANGDLDTTIIYYKWTEM